MLALMQENIGAIANVVAILVPIIGVKIWSYRKTNKQIEKIDKNMVALRDRMDAIETRIDHLYPLMMSLLRELKKGDGNE